jgi:hypothetical protein
MKIDTFPFDVVGDKLELHVRDPDFYWLVGALTILLVVNTVLIVKIRVFYNLLILFAICLIGVVYYSRKHHYTLDPAKKTFTYGVGNSIISQGYYRNIYIRMQYAINDKGSFF